jgi:hypothetical protein
MADAELIELPTRGTLDRAYTGRLRYCVRCDQAKLHTEENFRTCEEVRNGRPYRYVKKVCRKCEHLERVEYGRRNKDRQNRIRRLSPDKFAAYRKYNLKTKYGLTPEQYDILLESQDGKCAICRRENNGFSQSGRLQHFAVDHDHANGRVRGLLCAKCNHGLGEFGDNADKLRAAIQYLERQK